MTLVVPASFLNIFSCLLFPSNAEHSARSPPNHCSSLREAFSGSSGTSYVASTLLGWQILSPEGLWPLSFPLEQYGLHTYLNTGLLKGIPCDLQWKGSFCNFDCATRLQGFYPCVIVCLALTVYTRRWFGSLATLKDTEPGVHGIQFGSVDTLNPSFSLFHCSLLLTFLPLPGYFYDSLNPQLCPWRTILTIPLIHVRNLAKPLTHDSYGLAFLFLHKCLWSFLYLSPSVWHHLWPRKIGSLWFFSFIFAFLSSARRFCQFWQSLRSRSCEECFECEYPCNRWGGGPCGVGRHCRGWNGGNMTSQCNRKGFINLMSPQKRFFLELWSDVQTVK